MAIMADNSLKRNIGTRNVNFLLKLFSTNWQKQYLTIWYFTFNRKYNQKRINE